MENKEIIPRSVEEVYKEELRGLSEEELESFRAMPVIEMNRAERKKRLKFYSKALEDHKKKKPTIKFDLSDEDSQKQVFKMQSWATRYGILSRKLNDLHATGEQIIEARVRVKEQRDGNNSRVE